MNDRRKSLATFVVLLAVGATASCNKGCKDADAGVADSSQDSGSDGPTDARSEVVDRDAPVDAVNDLTTAPKDQEADADGWVPGGDPGWNDLTWATGCKNTQVASNPKFAVPALKWEDCGAGLPGCIRLVPNWPNAGIPFDRAQLYKSGSTLRFSLHMRFLGELRKAVYDESMIPVAAWRMDVTDGGCGSLLLQWTGKHLCQGLSGPTNLTHEAILPTDSPAGPPLKMYSTQGLVAESCNEELFVGSSSGGFPFIRDLVSGEPFWLTIPNAMGTIPQLSGSTAFLMAWGSGPTGETLTGWSWKRPNTLQQIIDPGQEMIFDIRSDGATLAWLQTTAKSIYQTAPGALWTSPHTAEPWETKPTKRRAIPSVGPSNELKGIGEGHYAIIEQSEDKPDRFLHLYRLADARHWQIHGPADLRPGHVIHVDHEEVWLMYTTLNNAKASILRHRIDALGPGD